jgi:hypothetical protein
VTRLPAPGHYGAFRGDDAAGVGHLRGDESDKPALGRGDVALVDDGAAARAFKGVTARHEILGLHLQRGGDDAADVDLRALGEEDAVWVEQEHVPVGVERALNHRNVGADNAVEGNRAGRGLDKVNGVAGTNVEALPVGSGLGGGLGDGQRGAALGDGLGAGNGLGAGGEGRGGGVRVRGRHERGAHGETRKGSATHPAEGASELEMGTERRR